ncbi:MAG: hypothetical protein WHS89_13725 [Acidimicrobiales bacterium]
MADPPTRPRPPRFNHVAMSVPATLLDPEGCAAVVDFYREVFGWEEMPTMTEYGTRLVQMAHRYDQFVFLISDNDPMRCPRLDHWGQAVSSFEELSQAYERARAYRERDERVDLIDPRVEEYPGLRLHSFYAGYLLPMMVETQFFEWQR